MFGKKKKENGTEIMLGFLVSGLPVIENSDLMLKLNQSNVTISFPTTTKQEFEIDISKVTSVDFYSETEMEKIVTQSAPGMIIGAAAFGILGAMVGGRVKTKEKKVETHFLLINYESNGSNQIVIKTNHPPSAIKVSNYFKSMKPTIPQKIEL